MKYYLAILFFPIALYSSAQVRVMGTLMKAGSKSLPLIFIRHLVSDTGNIQQEKPAFILIGENKARCKAGSFVFLEILPLVANPAKAGLAPSASPKVARTTPFITIHGNILYDVNYHSSIDTPYAVKNVYQHTVQSYLDVTLKNRYPFRVYLNSNFGNNGLFKDFTNLNFQFNNNSFFNGIKERLKSWDEQKLDYGGLEKMKQELDVKHSQLNTLGRWLNDGNTLQKLVEAREAVLISDLNRQRPPEKKPDTPLQAPNTDFKHFLAGAVGEQKSGFMLWKLFPAKKHKLPPPATDTASNIDYQTQYDARRKQYDSLNKALAKADYAYQQKKLRLQGMADSLRQATASIRDKNSLREKIASSQIPESLLPKGYRKLLAVKSFGLGSTPVNYSPLTVQNINITGVQLEYNPSYYLAFASGAVSYRFRDNIIGNPNRQKQYVTAVRFGRGHLDGNNVIFTYYTGRKDIYGYSPAAGGTASMPNLHLMGISLQSRYQVGRHAYLTAEVAKSSVPYYAPAGTQSHIFSSTFRFNDHSNEAYSVTFNSEVPQTQTSISANYRHTGNNFQSFGLFTASSVQTAWYIKVRQPFFKKRLVVDAALRANDFSNPNVKQTFSSTAVFKSLQATLRLRKMPVVTVGYFPSSQLIKVSSNYFREDLFYTLAGTATYAYLYRAVMMNTSLVYMQFCNRQPDSSFIYFNTKNVLLSQGAYFKRLTLQCSMSDASNNYYNLYSIGGSIRYKVGGWLLLGGGVKYNRQDIMDGGLLGYSADAQLKIKRVGQFDLRYDKGFIPGVNKDLVANEAGRVTYYKLF